VPTNNRQSGMQSILPSQSDGDFKFEILNLKF
jgi:hypothetical protein